MQEMPFDTLVSAAELLLDCYRRGSTVFVLGNGRSAATASHFACDLAKGTRTSGLPAFRVIPLSDNVPLLTAWANDTSYDRVFAEQLTTLARPADVVITISYLRQLFNNRLASIWQEVFKPLKRVTQPLGCNT